MPNGYPSDELQRLAVSFLRHIEIDDETPEERRKILCALMVRSYREGFAEACQGEEDGTE